MRSELWKGRRVLVTGHTGFKGSWLCLLLERLGAQVLGYAAGPVTTPNLFGAARLDETTRTVTGDICDATKIRECLDAHRPDLVLHMAAQALVTRAYDDPLDTYRVNVLGTAAVLEAVRRAGRRVAVINVTTDKCYENKEWPWGYREVDSLGGSDPYSASKACSELVTKSYISSFFPVGDFARHGVAIATVRAGNVVGGGDWAANRLIPDVVRAYSSGNTLEIRCPEAVRPWQHVLEPLRGYLTLAERLLADGPKYGGSWNFGSDPRDALTVGAIVRACARAWGRESTWSPMAARAPESRHLSLDSSKARLELGWRPLLGPEEVVRWTVDWYKAFYHGGDARSLCQEQIEAYAGVCRGGADDYAG